VPVLSRPLSGGRRLRRELAQTPPPRSVEEPREAKTRDRARCNVQLGARTAPRHDFRPRAAGAPDSNRRAPYRRDRWFGATARSQLNWTGLKFPSRSCGSFPFIPERFHVLLSSHFKVIFNSPPRYLFAIGLVVIHSLRWSLPPSYAPLSRNTTLRSKQYLNY